jgi:hypothetical protein
MDRTSFSVRITWAALAKWIALAIALFLGSDSPDGVTFSGFRVRLVCYFEGTVVYGGSAGRSILLSLGKSPKPRKIDLSGPQSVGQIW